MSKKKKLSQHFTPDDMVEKMLSMIPQEEFFLARVLEPSCGDGQILKKVLEYDIESITGIDIDPDLIQDLELEVEDDRVTLICGNFLKE